jgi:nucleoside-diphosphate-sugar epimerase
VFPVDINTKIEDPYSQDGQSLMYRISKVAAHQATRDFLEREKPGFKILTTHPVFVIGKSRIQSSAEQVDLVNNMLWSTIQNGNPETPSLWVDVKDVAAAHVRAIDCNAPSGTEFIHSGPSVSWEEIAEFAKQEYPQLSKLEANFEGPVTGAETVNVKKYLGMDWRPWKPTMREVIEQQLSFQGQGSK